MIEDTPSVHPIPPVKHRVRPTTNWRVLGITSALAATFILGLVAGFFVWGKPLSASRSEITNLTAELSQLRSSVPAGEATTSQAEGADQTAADGEIQQVTRYPIEEDDDSAYGPDNAAITIIEFSDYECPYCQTWHQQVWAKLAVEYPEQVRLVYRDFPLYSIHPNAESAANAANCANEQNKYWEFHDLLFNGGKKLGNGAYMSYANAIGLDVERFKQCLDGERYLDEVTADYEYGLSIGVQSTPTFFINGVALIGAQPYEVFKEVIELELAGKLSQ